MTNNEINLGSLPINVTEEVYLKFFNQKASGESRTNRAVFVNDFQRFAWAFVLGINEGKRRELGKGKRSSFKWSNIPNDMKPMMIALTLQELYKNKSSSLKNDLNNMSEDNFNIMLRNAIEEYANEGFYIIQVKQLSDSEYIESFDLIVNDILSDNTD